MSYFNTIPKMKLQPVDRIIKNNNNHNLEQDINYDSYLKQPSITCLKENKNNKPTYFYQKKRVTEPIETNNIKSNSNISNKHCSKHYPVPLIKNQPIRTDNVNNLIEIDSLTRGNCSRLNNDEFQREREANEDLRLQFLNKNFQDPNKLVLPFPRGGEMTREKYYKNQPNQ
ncbi:hypothetical protein crov192 [Cafeteria roenbergensis virus]|uniref:Uncharacterized protein n=1 Tax=Cafeteria roenbergensis virus (strain BV-PW1) TaxID=693272 RepID=E3T4W2_CROVB|nr:hypothetical protein crov192 [Cafeteria roenbergensis virus BV-PW1]ADO67225.1 hypothetical protein crov192 [Cafeteria roenbergensis virus BV-PW1]